jgi:hypothetical protein
LNEPALLISDKAECVVCARVLLAYSGAVLNDKRIVEMFGSDVVIASAIRREPEPGERPSFNDWKLCLSTLLQRASPEYASAVELAGEMQ